MTSLELTIPQYHALWRICRQFLDRTECYVQPGATAEPSLLQERAAAEAVVFPR